MRLSAIALVLLTLTGCATVRLDVETAVGELGATLPGSWTAAADTVPAPLTSHLLDLVDDDNLRAFVTEAVAANPDLRASALRLAAATALLTESRAIRWPYAEVGYSANRSNQGFDDFGERYVGTRQRLSLDVDWEVDVWRRLADLDHAAAALARGQAADHAAARDALGARVIQAWIHAVSLRQALAVERERVEVLDRLQDTIRRRYRRGLGQVEDLAAARAGSELAGATVAVLRGELDEALRTLELLAGRAPRTEMLVTGVLPPVDEAHPGCPGSALAARPDVVAAFCRLEAADHAAAAAAKAMLPGLRLTGNVARDGASLSALRNAASVWGILGSITQPIFDRGRLKARSTARARELEAAWQDYRSVVLGALGEVENHLGRERALVARRDHLDRALAESERNTRVQEDRYRRGLSSVMELLQARNQEMDTRRQVIAANGEILSNRVSLALSIGAGLEEQEL